MPEAGVTVALVGKRVGVFCAIVGALLLSAGAAGAISSHDPWKLREVRLGGIPVASAAGQCENCHTLDDTEGETATSYINRNARTLPEMRSFGGVPASFGCTFCHEVVTDNIYMKNALKDYEFTPPGRKHPVGVNVTGVNNNNEYFSTYDSLAQVDQLQCLDCHEAGLIMPGGMASYPYHVGRTTDAAPWTGTWNKALNPYALKGVAALGQERVNHCVNTCHGNLGAANGPTKPRMGHLGWGAYNGTTLFEPRGQALLQSNCGVCHDSHSSTKDRLISDGVGRVTTGVNPASPPDLLTSPETAIDMNNCTATCHIGSNVTSDYRTKGHGKLRNREDTINMNYNFIGCTPCHTSSVAHHDAANPKRFGFGEDTVPAGLPHNGSANLLDDNYNGQVDEPAEANWTQPLVSICQGCHSTYNGHYGAINGASPSYGSASCLDCHDPHGKGVGANIEMIRTTVGPGAGETTTFLNTADMAGLDDFYRADRNGVCDNTACHGRDLTTILADASINEHVGINIGDNCLGCHTHVTSGGAASFKPKCDLCHGYPPVSGGLPDYSQGIGVHQRHAALAIDCSECHFRNGALGNTHNEDAWSEPRGIPVPRGGIDVVFNTHGGTVNMNATYSGYNTGTGLMDGTFGAVHTCNNVTCHNPDSSTVGTGLTGKAGAVTNNVVSWADAFTPINACTGCHVQSPAGNPDNGSHFKHDNSTGGKGFPCQACHQAYYDAANSFATATGNHNNFTLQTTGVVSISGTLGAQAFTGTWNEGASSCAAVYCHGAGMGAGGDQLLPVWGPGAARAGGRCGDCHDADPTSDTFAPQDYLSTGNHTAHLNAPQGPNATCAACHPAYALNSASHVDGQKSFLNLDNTTVTTFGPTDVCGNCHGTSTANAKNATNWATGTFRLGCLECHDGTARSARTGGILAPKEDTYWVANGHGRTTAYNATLHGQNGPGYLCTVCHNQNAAHINGTVGDNRFRAVADDAIAFTSDVSEVCLDCHKVGQLAAPAPVNHLGFDALAEATVHSGALTGNYTTNVPPKVAFPAYGNAADFAASPGYQCEACHDPHGTTKLAMVRSSISGAFGDAVAVNVGAAFDAASPNLLGLDPTAGTNDGVCDVCHRASGNTNAHPDTAKVNNHNQGQNCVICHDHKNSFFAGCSDCHGGSQAGATRRNYWPDGAVGPNVAGAHAGHIADLARRLYNETVVQLLDDTASDAKQKHLCKYCHGINPGNDLDHGYTLPAEVSANLGRLWDPADPPAQTDAVVYNLPAGTRTCAAVECHYNTTTAGWLSGTPATCTTCHNNGTNNGALANSWPDVGAAGVGDHFAHYAALGADFAAVYGPTNTPCVPCHATQQPAVSFVDIVSMASHIDGDRFADTAIPVTFNDKSEGTVDVVGYTPALAPNENNGTCANVSCHGGSTIGATPAWRDGAITTTTVTTAECQKCHLRADGATNALGAEYIDARSGAHIDHDHGCQICHSAAPALHYSGITTVQMDNPTGTIVNAARFASYTDTTTAAFNPLTNGHFNGSATAAGVSGTCNTVTCHDNASPAWDVDLTATCGLCHLDSPTTNAHQAHVYNGATPDHTDCDACHPSSGYAVAAAGTHATFLGGTHATGVITVNLVAGIGASGTGGTTACATSCHARETTTTWNNTTVAMTCNSCHYYAAAPVAAGNVGAGAVGGTHNAHFYGAPTNIVCNDCHVNHAADTAAKRTHMKNTGAGDGAVLLNKALATQDEADVLPAVMNGAGDPDQPPVGVAATSNPTCTTALCHNPTPGAAFSAIWTGPANNSCGFCHADTTGIPASGSHAKHISYAAGYAPCAQCHVNNGATYTHMTRQVELAAGLTYSAALTPPYDNMSWGTCSAGACHNTDQDPAWGTAVPANSCGVCHINNNTVPASSTDSVPNFAGSDRVASQIGIGAEWSVRGHGAKAAPANTCAGCHDGVGVGHQPDLATSSNPFRLGSGYTNPDTFCTNTTTCHTGATVPGSNLVISHTYELMSPGLRQRTWPAWRPKCVDCHDPHGDANNLGMLSTDVFDRGSSTHGVPTETLNTINRSTDVVDFSVQGGISAGSFAQIPGADGVCQECHLANDGLATNLVSFQDDNAVPLAGNHPTGASINPCTQCHKHDKAFEPAGCNGCHGNTVTKQYWPDASGGSPAYVDDQAGSHGAHVLAISQGIYGQDIAQLLADPAADVRQKTICAFCHPDPGGNGHNTNNGAGVYASRVDVWFDTQNNAGTGSNYFQVFKVGALAWGNDAGTNGTYDTNTLRCSNVDCHYTRPTPAYAGLGWNGTGTQNCETCHYFRGTAAVGGPYPVVAWVAGDLPDSHPVHVAGIAPPSNTQSRSYLCSYCHVIPTVTAHANGDINLSTAGNPTLLKEAAPVADEAMTPGGGGLAVKYGVNAATSCTNLYCHGADFGAITGTSAATQGTNVAPVWNSHLTGACGTCHDVDTRSAPAIGQSFTEGKHQTHTRAGAAYAHGPYNYDIQVCMSCHGVVNAGAALPAGDLRPTRPNGGADLPGLASDAGWASFPSRSHVEANFEVDFENIDRGFNGIGDYDQTGGTVAVLGTLFSNGTDICNRCHSTATVSASIGATLAKQNWGTLSYRFPNCLSCHNAGLPAVVAWSTPVSGGVQAPNKETNFATAGHGKVAPNPTWGGNACVDCHDENSAHLSGVLGDTNRMSVVNVQNYTTGANAFCASACHATTLPVHYPNTRTAGGTSDDGVLCRTCHDPHGFSGQDAMISDLVAGRAVSGFANKTLAGSYFNAGNTGICQVCHDPAEVQHHNRTSGAGSTHSPSEPCTTCHQHNAAVAFAPRSCESCHNGVTAYVKGTATAPNVMGDGNNSAGTGAPTPKPYDNGTYGYNVNGHGRDDTPAVPGNSINVACSGCHNIDLPSGAHLNGIVDGRLTPSDTRTANSFHLISAYVKAVPTSDYDVQVTFDNVCATLCHGAGIQMRHAVDAVPFANAVQFGTNATYADPQNTPPPLMFYDRNLKSAATFGAYDGPPNFALCVSCHNPHGTNVVSPRADLNNKMMLYKWSNPSALCAKCHL